ncbi:hypothetical protein M569_15410 [Genlisea aurea]|uniref:PPM-type phosphatase domain-containing protein n=1 Tax=Genlisea aurea TaxID=192259 RepID=S8BYE3_9LAMI|nr:hypothetical protein M569_15410 [Genlisea aurea]
MGIKLRHLRLCFAGDEISRRRNGVVSGVSDEGFGHSFCYVSPDPAEDAHTHQHHTFRTISGAFISANASAPLSTETFSDGSLSKASAFESSELFNSIPLQPIIPAARGSDPIERGFLSGPIQRSFLSEPLDRRRRLPKSKNRSLLRSKLKALIPKFRRSNSSGQHRNRIDGESGGATAASPCDWNGDDESFDGKNLQWAQGKAGEDTVHLVISDEHVFVAIYDGFNGPDATHFLLTNLYANVHRELRGILWTETEPHRRPAADHSRVLEAMREGLRKTEESYLDVADLMMAENPELSLMGSCVLVMVMKGADVYLMNVGDSRAIVAQQRDDSGGGFPRKKMKMRKVYEESLCNLSSRQLTMDHTTSIKEEARRIKQEHPDDPSAITNHRVKGYLKVTRAFGAGFLKHPKWNEALLETFRIDYVGTSPYVTCSPHLFHYTLLPNDAFLILSSDGLYQYFTNQEVVSKLETFMAAFPEGDPAQHLVEEVVFRTAKRAGLEFRELLDVPQGDRRKYHDDVSIIVVSFQGRIWQSHHRVPGN